jgi:hypothetical protein
MGRSPSPCNPSRHTRFPFVRSPAHRTGPDVTKRNGSTTYVFSVGRLGRARATATRSRLKLLSSRSITLGAGHGPSRNTEGGAWTGWPLSPIGALGGAATNTNPEQATAGPRMDTPQHKPGGSRKRADRPHLPLRDLLAAVASARRTRLEAVCFRLNMDASRVRPAWDVALRTQLLEPVGIDPNTGETLYRLSDRGRRALRVLNVGRRPSDHG